MCPGGMSGGVNPKTILNNCQQRSQKGQQRPTDRREDGLVLLRKKFEVQQALFEVGAADADADFVT